MGFLSRRIYCICAQCNTVASVWVHGSNHASLEAMKVMKRLNNSHEGRAAERAHPATQFETI